VRIGDELLPEISVKIMNNNNSREQIIFLFVFARSTLMASTIALNSGLLASALLRGTLTSAIAVKMALSRPANGALTDNRSQRDFIGRNLFDSQLGTLQLAILAQVDVDLNNISENEDDIVEIQKKLTYFDRP
jgi:hypothetical protein